MAKRPNAAAGALARAESTLRAHALAKPHATEHFPWGERAIKVAGKVFLFMYADATRLSLSTKLPSSGNVALMLPFVEPTGYGLGKSGWVSARFAPDDSPPIEMLCAWIDESYQAVAPARLTADRGAPAQVTAARPARRAARKPAAKPARRPAAKPARRPAAKPVKRSTARPVKRSTAKPTRRPAARPR